MKSNATAQISSSDDTKKNCISRKTILSDGTDRSTCDDSHSMTDGTRSRWKTGDRSSKTAPTTSRLNLNTDKSESKQLSENVRDDIYDVHDYIKLNERASKSLAGRSSSHRHTKDYKNYPHKLGKRKQTDRD